MGDGARAEGVLNSHNDFSVARRSPTLRNEQFAEVLRFKKEIYRSSGIVALE